MADAHSDRAARAARPLSPHLQVYKPLINMVMSILHRITGAALYFGSALLAWWLIAIATGPEHFAVVSSVFQSWPGKIVLLGYTWALLNHMLGGLRHFIWDLGYGYDLATIDKLCFGSAALAVVATAVIWFWVAMDSGSVTP